MKRNLLHITLTLLTLTHPALADDKASRVYPPASDNLPKRKFLPDPFSFYWQNRTVKNLEDWKERRQEMQDLLFHYLTGQPIPHYYENAKEHKSSSQEVQEYHTTVHNTVLQLGPKNLSLTYQFQYFFPETDKPFPVIFQIVSSKYQIADQDVISTLLPRGYGFVRLSAGGKFSDKFHPEIEKCSLNQIGWLADETIHFLKQKYPSKIDKVIISGHSRFGKMAIGVALFSDQIDMTVPIVTGAGGVMTYRNPDAYGQCNKVFDTFEGKYDRIPIDFNFCTALIAPRPFLIIMGDEGPVKAEQLVEGYDAAKVVYRWMGVEERVGLYDHSPRPHEFEAPDLVTIMDFSDMIFYDKKPAVRKVEWFYENTGPRYLKKADVNGTGNWQVPPSVQIAPADAPAKKWFAEAQQLKGPVGLDKIVETKGTFEGTMKKQGLHFFPELKDGTVALIVLDKKGDEHLKEKAASLLGKEVIITATKREKDGSVVLENVTELKAK